MPTAPGYPGSAARCRGVTLVELMLAMTITAIIGLTVSAMLAAASYGTSSSRDLRELVVRSKTLGSRINAAIQQADRVLAIGDDFIVLWTDADRDGEPSLHELRRLTFDSEQGRLTAAAAAADAPSTAWTLDDDFKAITDALMAGNDFPARVWASRVSHWQITPDASDPQAIRLISHRLTLTAGDLHESSIHAAALRNH